MNRPDHFSVSQLTTFLNCPLAYRFRYIDGIETGVKPSGLVLGSAFHSAAERLHKHLMNGGVRKPDVYHEVLNSSLATELGNFDVKMKEDETPDSLVKEGFSLIDTYREYRTSQASKIVAAEHRIEREIANVRTGELLELPFVAFLDLVERNDDGLVVVDLKTAGRSYSQQDADSNLQLTAYALLVLLNTGELVHGLRIDAVIRNKHPKVQRLETRRTMDDFARFWTLVRAVQAAISADAFYPTPGWSCPTCEFSGYCNKWGME